MSGWRPIATAPRDGTRVILYRPPAPESGECIFVGWAATRANDWYDDEGMHTNKVTHWQPLPPPPEPGR